MVFGDSIVDTGNNNYITTIGKCNFLPYGRDFGKGNQATGRFSNGLVPSDIIAAKFGVKNLLPPYLDPKLQPEDLLTGVSFASGAAGYDPLTSKTAKPLDSYIFIFLKNNYNLLSVIELYGLGGRRIGVVNLPVIGCVPSQRTLHGGKQRNCSDFENQAAIIFNTKLSSLINNLTKEFPDARLVYLDIYNQLLNLIQKPATYGFEVTDKGCCGTGNIEVAILCNPLTQNICPNTSNYIFWDSFHPTEEAYKVICSEVIDNKIKDFF
uniref:GDSL esterase/lipase EXL1 n=1 Tax=Cajanus cajan TaxID=3821 RepID=A0A151RWI6_CAJCA|nr:GDSL esterase/lipase EXL1 [Cajanus cajan]